MPFSKVGKMVLVEPGNLRVVALLMSDNIPAIGLMDIDDDTSSDQVQEQLVTHRVDKTGVRVLIRLPNFDCLDGIINAVANVTKMLQEHGEQAPARGRWRYPFEGLFDNQN